MEVSCAVRRFFKSLGFKGLRCVIPVVCVTNEMEENVVKQHN